jgi:hypothetical protein
MSALDELDDKFNTGTLTAIELSIWWVSDKGLQENAIQELAQLRARIAELEAAREWQPIIEEISPDEGRFVIVDFGLGEIGVGVWFYEDCEHDEHEIGCAEYAQWMCWNYGDNQMSSCDIPVRWMPLPEPPEVKK